MKQKVFTTVALLFISISLIFATERNTNKPTKNKTEVEVSSSQGQAEVLKLHKEVRKHKKVSAGRRFLNRLARPFKKIVTKIKKIHIIRGLVAMIIGGALLIAGLTLTLLEAALIVAIILTVVGGILFIIGVLRRKG